MDTKNWMMLRVLINRYNPKTKDALLKFLPQEERQAVLAQKITSNDLMPILKHKQKCLELFHYSWIKPLLEKYPSNLHPIVIASLSAEQKVGLQGAKYQTVSPPVKTFIVNQIQSSLEIDQHLPLEYLPQTDLTLLAHWQKSQLIEIIDFLGLHDLANEIRYIVDRNHLKNIYTSLTPKQFYYLKVCLLQKEKITSPKLGIDPSKQDKAQLKQILHRRGLIRLGRALCGQHPDLVWYIAHILDTGRGKFLLKDYQIDPLPKITAILQQQVINLMNFLKSE